MSLFAPVSSTSNSKANTSSTQPSNSSGNANSNQQGGNAKILKDLLESANNFPKNKSDLGSIQLTIPGLKKQTDNLRKDIKDQTKNGSNSSHVRAHYLLASSGISAEEIQNELNALQTEGRLNLSGRLRETWGKQVNTSLPDDTVTNLDSYLNVKKGKNVLEAIESSLTSASKDFDKYVNQSVTIDWKVRKENIRKLHGISTKDSSTSLSSSTSNILLSQTNSASSNQELVPKVKWLNVNSNHYNLLAPLASSKPFVSVSSKQLTREKFESHARIVYQLNEARLNDNIFRLCLNFEEVSKATSDLKSKQVGEVWKFLAGLTDEKKSIINQEQKFHSSYILKDQDGLENLNTLLIKTSKNILETQFADYIDQFYNKQEETAEKLPPTAINKVITFIKKVGKIDATSQNVQNTLNINGVPIWALIFYLLRSGKHDEVLQLVNENADSFNKFDKNFPVYLSRFISNDGVVLPASLNDKLQNEFNQQFGFIITDDVSENFDVYKYAVYKIVGKCDLAKKSLPRSINLSIEDWLWFHFSLINETSTNILGAGESQLIFENYSLSDFQKQIIQLGPKKLNSSSNNPMYLRALIMCGLFELAVQYTYENINECDAVHLAIGLAYYGLLRVVDSSSKIIKDGLLEINPTTGECLINFGRFLGSYTRSFKISDPKVAAHYSILIALGNGGRSPSDYSVCHEAIRELILSTREFGLLLGEINPSTGERIPGLLENNRTLIGLPKIENYFNEIIEISANRCEEDGRIFDALLLHQLSQEYNTVVTLVSRLLGEYLSTSELDKPLYKPDDTIDTNVILLAQKIINTFNKNAHILDELLPAKKKTCDTLLEVVEIRKSFLSKDWEMTLQSIEKLELIPINDSENLISIRQSADKVHSSLDDNIVKVIPSLLILAMTSISQLSYSYMVTKYGNIQSQRDQLEKLKRQAKNCMIYAGMVQYKMPRETYSLLVNLEALL